ncbi:SRPBCC domain-containing protein [Pseudomonas fluorescens]|uniref:SRPBCC domain-containing protein n=1 Tax=Pseudomonas fluorescens TaxID=294 RepID=UPI0004D1033E|nr:SRPBCC domain-containing protein [Pseudomonas fluorescens]AIG02010.1 glutathione S-transferase [Pseudomonas fluorescens]
MTQATFQLEMNRFIRAPREKVFDAFTDQNALAVWHCPRGMHVLEASADARIGGQYRIVAANRNGTTHTIGGEYFTLDRANFLAYSWRQQGDASSNQPKTLIEVTLTEEKGGTHLHMRHSGFPDTESCDLHKTGWTSVLNHLNDFLDPDGRANTLTLIGLSASPYVRTVRMALEEKGIPYTHQSALPHSPEILAHNPFGRVPVLCDGPISLYETRAILSYLEDAFEGPSLLPKGNLLQRARGEQWISLINCHVYDAMISRYLLQYIFPKGGNGQPDRAVIDAAVPDIEKYFALFEQVYENRNYLVGNELSMADLFLAPMISSVVMFPEGAELLKKYPNVSRALSAMHERQSFKVTE